MKTNLFLKRVLWLLIPLLTIFTTNMWGATATWTLVESAPSDWSGEYLIVYNNNCFDGSLTSGFNGNAGKAVTISNKSITLDDQYAMIIAKPSGYTLQTASGYYLGRGANSNGVDASNSSSYTVTITWNNTSKTAKIAGTGGRCLGNNSGSWKFFSSSNAYVNVSLYKKAASCDKTVKLNYDGDASGLNGSFVLKAGSASGSTIAEGGTTANCGSGTTSVVVVPTPDTHYHVASVSATNKTGDISGPDGDGNYTITYTQGSNITSAITVTFEEDTKHTLTFYNNGVQVEQIQVYEGEKIGNAIPSLTTSDACDATSNVFAGWTTENVGSTPTHTIDASKIVDYWTEPTANMSIYALWATIPASATTTFAAADYSHENAPVEKTKDNVTLYFNAGQIYTSNTPYTFSVNYNSGEGYFNVAASNKVLAKLVTSCTTSSYCIDDVSDGNLSSSTAADQNITNINTSSVEGYPSSNGIRMKTCAVYCYDNYITTCQACVAPDHVDIGTQWGWFKGENLTLSATAYSTSGSGSPITSGITGYQWYKGGTAEGNKIAGATSATYTKENCTLDDAGDYYCEVSTGATCSTMSSAYGVKIYSLECYTGGTTSYNFTRIGSTQTGSVQIDLSANSSYHFKVRQGSNYYGNKGTITEDENTWEFNGNSDHDGNVTVTTYTAGKFTFTLDYSSNGASPILAVTYPARTLYLQLCSDWKAAPAKYAIYYWRTATGWSEDFMTATTCDADILYASIPSWAQYVIFGRFNPSKTSTGNWDGKYNQTSNQTLVYDKDYLYNVSGSNDSYSGTWGTYDPTTYTITFAGNGNTGGSMSDVTCISSGSNETLAANGFTKTDYTFTGWKADVAVTIGGSSVPAGTLIPDESTIQNITSNITLTAQWSVQSYNITWSVNNQTWTNGVTDANNHANHGATVTAPAGDGKVPTGAAMPCGTYTFMGWSAAITPTSEDGGSAPADLFTTTSPAITQETTFYAVFAEGGDGYTRATQVSDISVGSHIIIGYEADHSGAKGTVVPARSGDYNGTSYMRSGTTSGSTGSSTIDLTSTVSNESDYVFTVEAGHNTGYFALKGSDNKYIGHNGKNAAQAYDAIDADGKTDYSFAFGENDVVTITNKWGNENTTQDGSNNYHFQWLRYNSGSPRFAIYRTGQNDPVIYIVNSASNYKTYCDNTKAYVNYNAAGGTTSCEREAVTKGANYTICSSTPTKTGYTFQGWLSDEATPQTYQPNATISNVQNDIVLTAQWTATTYTITYNGVKTGATNTNPTSYTVEDLPINLVAATHDQWRFDGWTDDNAGNADITTIPAGTTGNQSFTAHWTARYAVTWYVESTPTIEYYDPGATLTFPSPDPSAPTSCSEKQFVGWMVGTIEGETDDKPTFVTAGEVNADAAYHAVWANAAGSAIAAIEDNTFTQSDVSRATYCGISNGLQSVGKYVQNQSIWNSTQMTGVNVKIKVYHVSNSTADVLRISLINSSGAEVVGTDLTTSKLGNGSSSAGYSSNVTLTPTTAVTGYKVSLKTKNSSGTAVGKVTREVVPAYSKYSTSCCDNNVAAPNVTATATRNSITLSWDNVTGATGYKVTINGGTYDVSTSSRTYTASGLTSGTDYAWVVIATYNPANYCGALPRKSTTATLSVYGVTYNKNTTIGSGTVTMSPMPTDASTYIVGESVTAAAKPATCTNSGYTFNGWNTEPDGTGDHVAAGGTIAMVEGGLTLYAEWVAKRAYYVDRMHGQGDQTIEIGGKTYHCYYGDGYHTTPSPSDQKSGDACQTPHYRFVRWLTIDHINNDGTQKNTGGAVGGGVQRGTAIDGETYYAIWEEEIVEP